jgi:hypothetical protein
MQRPSTLALSVISALLLPAFPGTANADNRPFTYTYEATTAPTGSIEYEQWITWRARRGDPGNMNRFDFRHELEFGITDRLQLGLYLSNWKVVDEKGRTSSFWDGVSVEAIYNLSNPTTDWIGSAIYGEVTVGDDLVVLEGKLILQKNIGKWIAAYNATIEAEWEGPRLRDNKGEFQQTLGVSYEVNPRWSVGAELLHEVEFDRWGPAGDHAVYVGPNLSCRFKRGFVTTTVLFQATGINSEPDVQTRLILGLRF